MIHVWHCGGVVLEKLGLMIMQVSVRTRTHI